MKIKIIMSNYEIKKFIQLLLNEKYDISLQLKNSMETFHLLENKFIISCEYKGSYISCIGFEINEVDYTITSPFFYINRKTPVFLKAKAIRYISDAINDTMKTFNDFSFFIIARPIVRKIITKVLSPPLEYIGVMKNYFIFDESNKQEDGFLFWKPLEKIRRR